MDDLWAQVRWRLLAVGIVGAIATLVSLLPGSWICALGLSAGARCGELDVAELVVSVLLVVIGFGGALALSVGSGGDEAEPARSDRGTPK